MTVPPVIVGVDGSESSKKALRWAATFGQMSGAPVEALITWDRPTTYGMPVIFDEAELKDRAEQILHDAIREVLGDQSLVIERVEQGHAAAVLVNAAEHAQLLVVGSHDHHHVLGRRLGSTSLHCVQQARCPVVVVRDQRLP